MDAPVLSYAGFVEAGVGDVPPVDSRLVLERLGDGVRITDPPSGWRGAVGQMVVAGVGVLLCVVLVVGLWRALRSPELSAVGALAVMLLGALCMTCAMCVVSWRAATRPAVIEARGGKLRVEQPGIIGGTREWPAGKIRELQGGAGAMGLGPLRVMSEVKVITGWWSTAKRVMGWRRPAEAEWMARVLRKELGLPEPVKS